MEGQLLANREIASLAILAVLLTSILLIGIRQNGTLIRSLGQAVSSFFRWQLLLPLLLYVLWVLVALIPALRIGAWDPSLWKTTVRWLLLSGFGYIFRFPAAVDQPEFFRRAILRTVGLVALAEFFTELASFPLWAEIPAQFFPLIFGSISAFGARRADHARVTKLANGYLWALGLSSIGWELWKLTRDWAEIDHAAFLREFLLPIWMTPFALMYVYALAVSSVYGTIFAMMTLAADEQPLVKQRLAVVLRAACRLPSLRVIRRSGAHRIGRTSGFTEAWNEIGQIMLEDRERIDGEKAAQRRLIENTGVTGVDSSGRQLDQREHQETMEALRSLSFCQMGHYRNLGHQYRQDLTLVIKNLAGEYALPTPNGIVMYVDDDGQRWYAERQTITGHWFGIGAAAAPSDQWLYDGIEQPNDFPNEEEWDQWVGGQLAANWD